MPLWTHKNVTALIYLNDHCKPHVTFVCPADGWTARIRFSMVKPNIKLIDVKPKKNAPTQSLLNQLANQLVARLDACRMEWWLTKNGELCIDNQPVERAVGGGVLMDGSLRTGRIIAKSGKYVQMTPTSAGWRVTASVRWRDGTVTHNETVE